jgi:hypothetical protein
MTKEQATQIFIKHSQFFELYAKDKYVPRAMEGLLAEITAAYIVHFPEFKDCRTCDKKVQMIVDANRIRLAELDRRAKLAAKEDIKQDLVYHKFPKKKKK